MQLPYCFLLSPIVHWNTLKKYCNLFLMKYFENLAIATKFSIKFHSFIYVMIVVVTHVYFYGSRHLISYQMVSTFKILLTAGTNLHIQTLFPCLTYWLLLQHCFCSLGSPWVNFVVVSHTLSSNFTSVLSAWRSPSGLEAVVPNEKSR